MGFKAITNAQPQKRPRAEDKCPAEGARGGVRAPDWKEKKVNGVARLMLLPGISHGDKVVPFLGTGNHLSHVARVQRARTLKNSTTKTQWPSLKRVNSATS